MFTRSPRGGKPPELEERLLENFFHNCSEAAISDYYVHTPYFINLASGKEDLRGKSVDLVREELERSSGLEGEIHDDPYRKRERNGKGCCDKQRGRLRSPNSRGLSGRNAASA